MLGDINRLCHASDEYLDGHRIFNTMASGKRSHLRDDEDEKSMDLSIELRTQRITKSDQVEWNQGNVKESSNQDG